MQRRVHLFEPMSWHPSRESLGPPRFKVRLASHELAKYLIDLEVLNVERLLNTWQINREGGGSSLQDSEYSWLSERTETVASPRPASNTVPNARFSNLTVAEFGRNFDIDDLRDSIYELGNLVRNKAAPWQDTWRGAVVDGPHRERFAVIDTSTRLEQLLTGAQSRELFEKYGDRNDPQNSVTNASSVCVVRNHDSHSQPK